MRTILSGRCWLLLGLTAILSGQAIGNEIKGAQEMTSMSTTSHCNAFAKQSAATSAPLLTPNAASADTHKVYGTHVSVTKQPIGVRRLVDLHVPTNHGSEPNFYKVARHSRAVLESSSHPAPKTPTFSVFSALHDSMLGEVNAMPLSCFASLHHFQPLSSARSLH